MPATARRTPTGDIRTGACGRRQARSTATMARPSSGEAAVERASRRSGRSTAAARRRKRMAVTASRQGPGSPRWRSAQSAPPRCGTRERDSQTLTATIPARPIGARTRIASRPDPMMRAASPASRRPARGDIAASAAASRAPKRMRVGESAQNAPIASAMRAASYNGVAIPRLARDAGITRRPMTQRTRSTRPSAPGRFKTLSHRAPQR